MGWSAGKCYVFYTNRWNSLKNNSKMIRIHLTLFLFISSCSYSIAQIEIMNNFDLGKYSVGFKHEIIKDFSRSYGDSFRPVELFIWYPSEIKIKNPLYYTDYFLLNSNGQNKNKSAIDSLLLIEINSRNIDDLADIESVLSKYKKLRTIAQEGIAISNKSFPLVLFAPGGNTSGQLHSALCEYLASHGNIVVSIPSLGNADTLRWPFNQTGLNLQMDDMAFAINHLANTMQNLSIEKICLISWSVGGVSQGILSMKNSSIDMLISLDSGLGRSYGVEMIKESPYFDYNKIRIPYLHMTGKAPEQYDVERSAEFYDSIPSNEKYLRIIEPFAHEHFTSQLGLIPAIVSKKNNTIIINSYVKMSQLTLGFINAFLKNDPESKQNWFNN